MPIYKMTDEKGKNIRKDGLQKYRVRVNYTDALGKPRQITRVAYGSDAAKALEMQLTNSAKHETPAQKISVGQLYDEYLNAKKHEVRESTLEKSRVILSHHIVPILSNIKIDKLSIPVLEDWKRQTEDKGLSIRMRKNIYSEFRAMLNYAVKMEYIQKNPLLKVGNFKAPMEMHKEMLFYTQEEFQKFISAAREYCEKSEAEGSLYNWNYYVFFCIAFYMGARKGEIYALQWSDVRGGELSITKSISQKLKGEDRVTPPKNRSSIRVIEIPEPLMDVLEEHRRRCEQLDGFTESYYICGGRRAIRDTTVQHMSEKFSSAAGVKKIRLHDFRHSHASLLANEGINIQEIARRLGHSNVEITLRTYSHLYPREAERAVGVLNRVKI